MNTTSGTGISIFLIAVGAILYFAVSASVTGLSLDAVGIVLILVGILGLLVSLGTSAAVRGGDRQTTVVEDAPPAQRRTTIVEEGRR